MSKTKTVTYTANDRAIVAVLKGADHPMTLAEINEKAHLNLKAGSITSALRKGLITKCGDKVPVKRRTKHKVSTYSFVTAEVLIEVRNDGGAPKPYNYTPSETAILATASTMPKDKPFTLAELSAAHGSEVKSGNINSLLNKGNLVKVGTRIVDAWTTTKVSTYVFAADVPADGAANFAADSTEASTTSKQA